MISGKDIPYKPLADAVDEQWKKYSEERISILNDVLLPHCSINLGIDTAEFYEKLKKAEEYYEAGDYLNAGNLCADILVDSREMVFIKIFA